jgi:hypothetical protein
MFMFLVPSIVGALVAGAAGPADLAESAPAPPVVVEVAVHGLEPLPARDRTRLREEASRIWDGAGVTLRWIEPDAAVRPAIRVRVDWTSAPNPEPCDGRATLGTIDMVGGHVRGDTIRIAASAAVDLVQCARQRRDVTSMPWPAALRTRLLARVLARVIAHEIGHYLLGPSHADRGLMRANLSAAELLAPLPGRYRWPHPAPRIASRTAVARPEDEDCSLSAFPSVQ